MQDNNQTNSLETQPVLALLLKYSIPAIIGVTASSIYNIIDRVFIGQGVGPLAISGLALTFPLMNLSLAFGTLVGAGASAITSIRLGEKRNAEAINILGNAFILNIIIGLLYSAVVLYFLDDILYAFGASKDTLPYAKEFMQIILIGNVVTHIYFGLNNIMRASGYPKKSMKTMLVSVLLNLILAPIFIFVFHWGIRGAAFATVLCQLVGMFMVLFHFSTKVDNVHFTKECFKIDIKIVSDIFSIGMSPFLLHICSSMVAMIMNISLSQYGGDMSIGAYGIINSILGLFIMIVVGLNQGMQPIVGYNFGAKNYKRVIKTYKNTVIIGTGITTVGFLISHIFPSLIAKAFTNDENLISISIVGLKIMTLSFPFVGFQMVTSNFFQSIGKPKISIFLSLSRQVVFLIPALFFVPHFFGLMGVWAATPVADVISFLVTFFVLQSQIKKLQSQDALSSMKGVI